VLLGLRPWPEVFFVSFNLIWLVAWVVALLTVKRARIALFPLWFSDHCIGRTHVWALRPAKTCWAALHGRVLCGQSAVTFRRTEA